MCIIYNQKEFQDGVLSLFVPLLTSMGLQGCAWELVELSLRFLFFLSLAAEKTNLLTPYSFFTLILNSSLTSLSSFLAVPIPSQIACGSEWTELVYKIMRACIMTRKNSGKHVSQKWLNGLCFFQINFYRSHIDKSARIKLLSCLEYTHMSLIRHKLYKLP